MTTTENRRPSTAIIDLVARVDGVDPIALEPLYNAIDPDKLDSICDPSTGFRELTFVYEGRTITVEAIDGGVEVSLEGTEYPGTESAGTTDAESSL